MLEVKLKEVASKNVVKTNGSIQYWRNEHEGRIITVHLRDNLVRVYLVSEGPDTWVTDNIDTFNKTMINDMGYVECNENWEKEGSIVYGSTVDIQDVVEIRGVHYWKTKEGELYMSMWNRLRGIQPTLVPVNSSTSTPVVFTNEQGLLEEMKRLDLYKVHNMRLEEF